MTFENIPKMYCLSLNIFKILCIMTQNPRNTEYQKWKRRVGGMMEHKLYARFCTKYFTIILPTALLNGNIYETLRL